MNPLVLAFTVGMIQAAPSHSEGGVALHLLLLNPGGTEQKKIIQYVNNAFWDLNDACKLKIAKSHDEYKAFAAKRKAIQEAPDLVSILDQYPHDSPHTIHTLRKAEVPMVKPYGNEPQPDAFVVDRTFDAYSDGMFFTMRFADHNTLSFVMPNELVFAVSEVLDNILDIGKWRSKTTSYVH